ncbi:HemK methyltransferase family member 2-like protein [Tanacetum coccineum]
MPPKIAQIRLVSSHPQVYEPCDDSFALVDASLLADKTKLLEHHPSICMEIGSGSGYVITSLALLLQELISAISRISELEKISAPNLGGIKRRLSGLVDVMVVNPPYVPTRKEEVGSVRITSSWAGGENGRSVIDKILPIADNLLSEKGWLYLLFLAANDPLQICLQMRDKGFASKIVVQRSTEEESLHVIKIWRDPDIRLEGNKAGSMAKTESEKMGLGFVARNHNGEVLLSGARGECFASSPLEAEAKAILWAMSHAWSRSYTNVVFESDSLCLVNALRIRQGNKVAHSIAAWVVGCNIEIVLEGRVPDYALECVMEDVRLSAKVNSTNSMLLKLISMLETLLNKSIPIPDDFFMAQAVETLTELMTSAKPATTLSSVPAKGRRRSQMPINKTRNQFHHSLMTPLTQSTLRHMRGCIILHWSLSKKRKKDESEQKKFKVEISKPNPITSMRPPDISYEEFTRQLFGSEIKHHSSGSAQSVPQVTVFTKHGRSVFHSAEEAIQMLKEQNRLADIKAAEEADAKALDNIKLS